MIKKIGLIIRNGRIKKNLSQKDLAKMVGVNQSHVSKWENDESVPTGDTLLNLADILDIVPELFPGYKKEESPPPIEEKESEFVRREDFERRIDRIEQALSRIEQALSSSGIIKIENNNGIALGKMTGGHVEVAKK